jgi:AbrB family looped-hinge helix DNA binding protein
VTIPVAIRRKFGLKGGSKLLVSVKMNGDGIPPALILTPVGTKRR